MPKKVNARSPSLTSQESYKAVIIADLVAEVQEEREIDSNDSKEETDYENTKDIPAVVNVDSMETVDMKSARNGTDISKGVILNAIQFGLTDNNSKTEIGKVIPTNPPPMTEIEINQKGKKATFKEEFDQMSALRKIAFGFSFLPSVMFVLCFAVIFPCEKIPPCIKEQWSITMNNTGITSKLIVPKDIVFSFTNEAVTGLRGISDSSGEILWQHTQTPSIQFIECGYLAKSDVQSCLVLDNKRTLDIVEPSDGKKLWQRKADKGEIFYSPTVVPGCKKDGLDGIAVAVSKTQIKFISLDKNMSLEVSSCDNIPSQFMVWNYEDKTEFIYTCHRGNMEMLMKVPHWCSGNIQKEKIVSLISRNSGILTKSKFLATENGLIIWTDEDVMMLNSSGQQLWQIPRNNHSSNNRFLLHGKSSTGNMIVLYSSDTLQNFQITCIDTSKGLVIKSQNISNIELSQAVLVHGENRDLVVGLKRKITNSLRNTAVSQINEVSAAVINILTNEEMNLTLYNSTSPIEEEIALMELDGSEIQTINSEIISEGKSLTSMITVVLQEEEKSKRLKVYLLRKPKNDRTETLTTIKSIDVSNWDLSVSEATHCAWKQ